MKQVALMVVLAAVLVGCGKDEIGNEKYEGVVAGKACDVAYKNQANVAKCKAAEGRGGDK